MNEAAVDSMNEAIVDSTTEATVDSMNGNGDHDGPCPMEEEKPVGRKGDEENQCFVFRGTNMSPGDREAAIREILLDEEDALAASEVEGQWSKYLRKSLPQRSWLALWDSTASVEVKDRDNRDPQEVTCVDVIEVDFSSMEARVEVIHCPQSLQEDLMADPERSVRLLELYPMLEEDEKDEAERAQKALDHWRFFYRYLWRPWDDEEDLDDWVDACLDSRMELYQQFKAEGARCRRWNDSVALCKRYRRVIKELETLLAAPEEDSQEEVLGLKVELVREEFTLRSRARVLDDPIAYESLLRLNLARLKERHPEGSCFNVVVPPSSCAAAKELLQVALDGREGIVMTYHDAQTALDNSLRGDVLLLPKGQFFFEDFGDLEHGGEIVGIEEGVQVVCGHWYRDSKDGFITTNASVMFCH